MEDRTTSRKNPVMRCSVMVSWLALTCPCDQIVKIVLEGSR